MCRIRASESYFKSICRVNRGARTHDFLPVDLMNSSGNIYNGIRQVERKGFIEISVWFSEDCISMLRLILLDLM